MVNATLKSPIFKRKNQNCFLRVAQNLKERDFNSPLYEEQCHILGIYGMLTVNTM